MTEPNEDEDPDAGIPAGVPPIYDTRTINEHVTLYEGPLVIHAEATKFGPASTVTAEGRIYLRWVPHVAVEFEVSVLPPPVLSFSLQRGSVEIPDRGWRAAFRWQTAGAGLRAACTEPLEGFMPGCPAELQELIFHVANADVGHADAILFGTTMVAGRLHYEADGWIVDIDEVEDHATRIEELKANSGYLVTAVGRVTRKDGATFRPDDAEHLLFALDAFMPFIWGRWVRPFLFVGRSADGTRSWERWEATHLEPWSGVTSWISPNETCHLGPTFAKFLERLKHPRWGETLRRAIHWWVESLGQAGAMEGAIALAQNAIELLWWTNFSETNGRTPTREEDRRFAYRKLRDLLGIQSLPLEIPVEQPRLHELAKRHPPPPGETTVDGPWLLTRVRNRIVHPIVDPATELDLETTYEAWRLSQHYLEVLLLMFMGHDGEHRPRIRADRNFATSVPVPWATPSP